MKTVFRNLLTLGILWGAGIAATAAMTQTAETNDKDDNNTNTAPKNDDIPEDNIPEFEKYSGHKVSEVEELLNSVTHSGPYDHILRRSYFHIIFNNIMFPHFI